MAEGPSIAFQSGRNSDFHGAKVVVFVGADIVTILRDDVDGIPHPGHWDLPGGGRENWESPWGCAARECLEETSLRLDASDIVWGRAYQTASGTSWFFVAKVAKARANELILGDEGQRLVLMSTQAYLTHARAISTFQKRLADWISGMPSQA